jgi:predicted RNA-binding protein with PUA-like domain
MKFKVGDEIFIKHVTYGLPVEFVGTTQVVTSITGDDVCFEALHDMYLPDGQAYQWVTHVSGIEDAEVFNSPLYQALK